MPFDAVFLHSVIDELKTVCIGAKVEKIFQPEKDEIVLNLRNEQNFKLLISANANYPRIHITQVNKNNPEKPPMFCMLLRKHFTSGILLNIEQLSFERAVKLTFQTTNEFFDTEVKSIILEVLGRQSNIILLNGEDRIIDSLKKIDISEKASRQVIPGILYALPDSQNKLNPLDSFNEIENALLIDEQMVPCEKVLMGNIMGISPLIARELVFGSNIPLDELYGQLRRSHIENLVKVIKAFFEDMKQGNHKPVMLVDEKGNFKDYTVIDIYQYANKFSSQQQKTFSEMLDSFYAKKEQVENIQQKSSNLLKYINSTIEKISNKITHQKEELKQSCDREKYRIYGELLTANIATIDKGIKSVKLQNYYDENLSEIIIPLDEKKSAAQNATQYFKKYQKLKTAEQILKEQIERGKVELEYFISIKDMLLLCEKESDIEEIKNELIELGYLKKGASKKKKNAPAKFLEFMSSDGYKIYVGRNNIQNDLLTTKIADRSDYWLHALNMTGSHVILFTGGNEPSDTALTEAAEIAAYYSKGRQGNNVPVTYTLIKNVKKPKGTKPGFVIFSTSRTAYVTPDVVKINKLKKSGN